MDRSTQIKAMASDKRVEILRLLSAPETHFSQQWSADPVAVGVCIQLIAEALNIAQPTASRHVELLKHAGFITVQKQQKWSYCKRDDAALQDYFQWLKGEINLP